MRQVLRISFYVDNPRQKAACDADTAMIACVAGIYVDRKDTPVVLFDFPLASYPLGPYRTVVTALALWVRVRANRFMRGPVSGILGGLGGATSLRVVT